MHQPWPLPFWIAHRGAGRLAPENTLAAFRVGAQQGYRAFECDVKLAADGVPYLMHDDTLDRCSSARGDASAWAWSALSQLDAGSWHSPGFAGEPPASLAAVVAWARAQGMALNLELKPLPGQAHATGAGVAQWLRTHWPDAASHVLLSSFDPDALAGAHRTAPELPRGLLLETLRNDWATIAQSLDCCAVITHHRLMSEALIEQLHAEQRRALVYTVNDPDQAHTLRRWGLDGLITDAVDRLPPAR